MKTYIFAALIFISILSVTSIHKASSQTPAHTLIIETSKGKMKCILYEQTPMHADNFIQLVNEFRWYWRSVWLVYGPTDQGWKQFQAIIESTRARLTDLPDLFLRSNGTSAATVLNAWVLNAALDAEQFMNNPATMGVGSNKAVNAKA